MQKLFSRNPEKGLIVLDYMVVDARNETRCSVRLGRTRSLCIHWWSKGYARLKVERGARGWYFDWWRVSVEYEWNPTGIEWDEIYGQETTITPLQFSDAVEVCTAYRPLRLEEIERYKEQMEYTITKLRLITDAHVRALNADNAPATP